MTTNQQATPIALVTGGSRGLGQSMANNLGDRGVDVILTYRSSAEEAGEVVASLESKGRKAVALALDVRQSARFPSFADEVRDVLARTWRRDTFDFLINNAGSGVHAPFVETTEEQLVEQFEVHLKAAYLLTQRLLPLVADGGRILNITTGLTRYTYAGQSAYAVMKGGVDVLTRYLAAELGPRRITVNAIAPGGVETDFGGGVLRDPALKSFVASQTALGRMGAPDDIGKLVALLLSPDAGWITGQRLEATGGYLL